jgi:glycerol uptake facilitator protein
MKKPSLFGECVAEFTGTMILTFFICGAVNVAVFTGALVGLLQVALVCGLGVTVGIYASAGISGAHLNPAITLAMTVWRGFPVKKVGPFIFAQLLGGFAAGLLTYAMYHGVVAEFEIAKHIVRGAPGSELSAMAFGEYFPNPAGGLSVTAVPLAVAFLAEALGTAVLAMAIFAFTEKRNGVNPNWMTPLLIGLTVAILISLIGPLTQAGFNPARDFGPRFAALLFGWGNIALFGTHGGTVQVYILAPILGAILGGAFYQLLLRRHLPQLGEELEIGVERERVNA